MNKLVLISLRVFIPFSYALTALFVVSALGAAITGHYWHLLGYLANIFLILPMWRAEARRAIAKTAIPHTQDSAEG